MSPSRTVHVEFHPFLLHPVVQTPDLLSLASGVGMPHIVGFVAVWIIGKLGVLASEEEDHPVLVEEAYNSKYVAVFDPLDGSSNIDAAISTGTIFGIFEETEVLVTRSYCNLDVGLGMGCVIHVIGKRSWTRLSSSSQ